MNRIIKSTIMFAAVALCAISCTKQEPVGFKYTTLEEKNPALYQEYLEGLRAYRATDHKVMIARVDNIATTPVGRADHLNSIPDSVDFIVLNSPVVSEAVLSEAATLREVKAQKTLLSIDYTAIDKAYQLYVEDFVAPEPEEGKEPETPITEEEFIGEAVKGFLEIFERTNLDGFLASYEGKNPASLTTEDSTAVASLQTAFFGPLVSRIGSTGKTFFFEGNARNIIVEKELKVLELAKYIIAPVESKTNALAIDNVVLNMLTSDFVPKDKFVAGVAALDVTDKQATNGLFSGESSAAVGAAYWALTPAAGYSKCGVCVNHAQYDYYHIGADFCEIRKAISVMNPSPVK